MEETHKIEPFNPRYIHETIFRHQQLFLTEILKFGVVPAIFPDIMAKLYYHVNQRYLSEVDATELHELRTMLPEMEQPFYDQLPLVPACDLFFAAEIAAILTEPNLEPNSPCFRPINVQIARLYRLSDQLSTDRTLCELLHKLIEYYENFRSALCAPGADKSELLTPKAYICGIDLQHYEISYELALRIICRTSTGAINRENIFGNNPGVKIYGTYCKPVGISNTLGTGKENAAAKFCQSFNRKYRVQTPVTLLKLSHVKINSDKTDESLIPILKSYHTNDYMERIVQSAMLSDGELLQLVLELLSVFKHWQEVLGDEKLVVLLKQADDGGDLEELMASSDLDDKAKKDIPLYLQTLRRIIKDYTPARAVTELPSLLSHIDGYSLCSAILTNVILNATDLKADNIMLRWDDSSGLRKFYFEVIDGDLIWQHPIISTRSGHYFTLRCIFLLFDLNIPFSADLRRELLEHPAIYFLLSWLQLIHADEQRFNLRVQQRAFTESDLHIENTPTVDRPLKFHPAILPRMLMLLQRAQNLLASKEEWTLAEFIEAFMPLYAKYQSVVAAPHASNILAAYNALNRAPVIEEVLDSGLLQQHDLDNYSASDAINNANLSCEQAICALIAEYRHQFDSREELKLLEYIGANFPFVKKLSIPNAKLNALLLQSADCLLPHAMQLLLACGADVNCENKMRERLLHRVMSNPELDKVADREVIITKLLSHVAIDLQAINQSGETPLMTFIRHAKNYPEDFIEFVVMSFKARHADLNMLTPIGTVLDVAVNLEVIAIFSILVKHGAYALKEPGSAVKFVRAHQDEAGVNSAVKMLSVRNPNFHYKRALSLISSKKRESKQNAFINGEYHQGCYLNSTMSKRLFDAEGDLIQANKIVEMTHAGELLLFAVVESHHSGIDIAVTRLHRILGSYTAPYSEVFQCVNRNEEAFPLMLTGAPTGEKLTTVLVNPERLQDVKDNIDRNSLTKLFFIQALMGQVYCSTDNIVVVEYGEGNLRRFCLVSILNETPFLPEMVAQENDKQQKIFHYLEAFFSVPFDPGAILELTHFNARNALEAWLNMLDVHEDRMKAFFHQGKRPQAGRGLGATLMSVPLAPGIIKSLFVRAKTLCEILQKNTHPEFNGGDFLRCAQALFKNHSKPELTVNDTPRAKSLIAKIASPRRLSRSSNNKPQEKFCVADAQQELREIQQDDGILSMVIAEIQRGNFDLFDKLILDYFKQAAVNAISWKSIESRMAKTILEHIIKAKIHFTELYLVDCHQLNDQRLKTLLKNSPNLRLLNLAGSAEISNKLYSYITNFCPIIDELVLDRTLITELLLGELRQLRRVSAANCMNLTMVQIHSPMLTELNLFSSAVKMLVLSQTTILKKLNVSGCVNLDPAHLAKVLFTSVHWEEFQHIDVQPFDPCGYVRSVLRDNRISPSISQSLVHGGVLNLCGMPIRDKLLLEIVNHLCTPDKFSLILHPSQIITAVDLSGCQNISHHAIASLIARLPNLEKLTCQLGEMKHLYLGFCKALPSIQLTLLTENHASYLKLTYPSNGSKIERQALENLKDFINNFFPDTKFTVIYNEESIVIQNCPLEELCVYQTLFDALVQRAQLSPRKLLASQQRFTSSIGLDSNELVTRQDRTSQENYNARK